MLKPKLKFSSFVCPSLGLDLGAGQVTQFDKTCIGIQVGNETYVIPRGEGIAYYVKIVINTTLPLKGNGLPMVHPFGNLR